MPQPLLSEVAGDEAWPFSGIRVQLIPVPLTITRGAWHHRYCPGVAQQHKRACSARGNGFNLWAVV
eukprot:2468312-Pyramimonas_sp.AAC.1